MRWRNVPTTQTTSTLKCDVDGCKDPVLVKKRRLCRKHYTRWQRYGTPHGLSQNRRPPMRMSPEERFDWYTVQEGEHWMWTGPTIGREVCDYGRIYLGPDAKPRTELAHRWAYRRFIAEIPDGCELDHIPECRITLCCNPWHLEPVPHKINVLRGMSPSAEHARKDACPKCGGPYTVLGDGRRECRPCVNASARDWTRRTGRVTGEGRAAQQRAKTHCPAGHEYTEENTYRPPKNPNRRDCLTCRRERSRLGHEQERQNRAPKEKAAYCVNGHEYTPENTFIRSNGRRSCRACMGKRRKQGLQRKRVKRLNSPEPSKRKLCPLDCTCGRHTRSGPPRRKIPQP